MKDFKGKRIIGAVYRNKDFGGADFSGAELVDVDFYSCDFRGADFSGIKLEGVSFNQCLFDIMETDDFWSTLELTQFYKANIRVTYKSYNIYGSSYKYVTILPKDIFCPVDTAGQELIVYKKIHVDANFIIYGNAVAKLRIPADADRIVYKDDKCRASCAKVLDIISKNGKHYNSGNSIYYYNVVKYKIGEMVYPDSFDSDPMNECSHGIHFFLTEEEAIKY